MPWHRGRAIPGEPAALPCGGGDGGGDGMSEVAGAGVLGLGQGGRRRKTGMRVKPDW